MTARARISAPPFPGGIAPLLTLLLALLQLPTLGISACQDTDADNDGYSIEQGDCDDTDDTIYPGADEVCDGQDNDCDADIDEDVGTLWYFDADGDGFGDGDVPRSACAQPTGYVQNDWDCDDANAAVYPGADEKANSRDDDCDGRVDEGTSDVDADGFTPNTGDCDDTNAAVRPGATETCDGLDNDCDGRVDEDLPRTWFRDVDGDGFGATDTPAPVTATCVQPAGYVAARGDCNDADTTVRPGAADALNDGKDQDCGGTAGPEPHVGFGSSSRATLQAAIDEAGIGATIWVGPGTYLEHDLVFRGKAVKLMSTRLAAGTVVDAAAAGPVFRFAGETSSSVLDGFTLRNGYGATTCGGVCVSAASPTLANLVITDCRSDVSGGGMSIDLSTGNVFSNLTIAGNHAVKDGGGIVLSSSSVELRGLTVVDNRSGGNGGGLAATGFSGRIVNALFADNVAADGTASGEGGALYLAGATGRLEQSTVVGNHARDAGGVRLESSPSFTVTNTLLAYNTGYNLYAAGGTPVLTYSDLYGFRGPNHNLSSLDATNRTVDPKLMVWSNDLSPWDDDLHLAPGSPLSNAGDPAVLDADGTRSDIGIYGGPLSDANLYYRDLDKDGMYDGWELAHGLNPAASSDVTADPDKDSAANATEFTQRTDPRAGDTDGDGSNDSAEILAASSPTDWYSQPGVSGPAVADVPARFASIQAAIDRIQQQGSVRIGLGYFDPVRVYGKTVQIAGASIDDSQVVGGAEPAVGLEAFWSSIDVSDLTIAGHTSMFARGGGLHLRAVDGALTGLMIRDNHAQHGYGGGAALEASDVVISGCTFQDNRATGYGVGTTNAYVGNGAALYLEGSDPSIEDTAFLRNVIVGYTEPTSGSYFVGNGGAILATGSSPAFARCLFQDNDADEGDGGAMYLISSPARIEDTTFERNRADYGAVLLLETSKAVLDNCLMSRNTADTYAGGMYIYNSSPTITNTRFEYNTAGGTSTGSGGAIATSAGSAASFVNCAFQHNSATYGGAIYIYGASPSITSCAIVDNQAKTLGGGIYMAAGVMSPAVTGSILAYNDNYNAYINKENSTGSPSWGYNDLYSPTGSNNHNVGPLDATNKTVEPAFLAYGGSQSRPVDLHLAAASTLVNAGPTTVTDPDGSRSDMGMYGGPGAKAYDTDLDGYPDWFWPGPFSSPPSGVSASGYDCDDRDPTLHQCGG